MEKSKKTSPKYDIVKIIKECAKHNVSKIKVDNIEIEFNTTTKTHSKIEGALEIPSVDDTEFEKEAEKQKEEIEQLSQQLDEENFICNDYDSYEEKAIAKVMGANNAE